MTAPTAAEAARVYAPDTSTAVLRVARALPYVALLISVVPILVGYGWLVVATFSRRTQGLSPVGGFTLDNWGFLDDAEIWIATRNSFIVAMLTVLIVTSVSASCGYALSRMSFPGRRAFLSGTLILHAFRPEMLIIGTFQVLLFAGGIPIIGEYVGFNTMGGVALTLVTIELPLGIWLMKGFFDGVSWDVERAALIDGASRARVFWQVLFPQVQPGLAAIAILMFIQGWNAYLIPQTFTIGTNVSTLSVYLNQFSGDTSFQSWNQVAALGLFQMVPVLVFFLFTQRRLMQALGSGMKGT